MRSLQCRKRSRLKRLHSQTHPVKTRFAKSSSFFVVKRFRIRLQTGLTTRHQRGAGCKFPAQPTQLFSTQKRGCATPHEPGVHGHRLIFTPWNQTGQLRPHSIEIGVNAISPAHSDRKIAIAALFGAKRHMNI